MKRILLAIAVVIVLAANAAVQLRARLNRSGTPVTEIEFTERELRLEEADEDKTARFLLLEWEGVARPFSRKVEEEAGWFDLAKLRELGYAIEREPADPESARRVEALPITQAFLVLHYDPEGTVPRPAGGDVLRTRLIAVDAGRDAAVLRSKYPDTRRHLILPCMIRPAVKQRFEEKTRTDKIEYVRGMITDLSGARIYVPPEGTRILQPLGLSSTTKYLSSPEASSRGPRYAATLCVGRNYEPWLKDIRLLQ